MVILRFLAVCILALFVRRAYAESWIFDAALSAAYLERENSGTLFDSEFRPSIQVAAHKAMSDELRFGTRFDWLIGDSAISPHVVYWRFGDIDWRFSSNWAVNIGAGAVRFYREQPAYGYGYSLGLKYSLSSHMFVMLDTTFANTDISTGVPSDEGLGSKDNLNWYSVGVSIVF